MIAAAGSTAAGRSAPTDTASPGTPAASPRVDGRASAPGTAQPKVIAGSTFRESLRSGGEDPKMVVVPAGSFRMGCLSNDGDCRDAEKPVHEVTISARSRCRFTR